MKRHSRVRKSRRPAGNPAGLRAFAQARDHDLTARDLGLNEQDRRDLTSRTIALRLDTIDEKERSVRCTIATENIVTVFDWQEFRMIDEVLLVSGFQSAPHVSFLDNHQRRNDDVFGSLVDFQVREGAIDCKIVMVDMSAHKDDPEAQRVERAWTRLRQGHNRNVSAGYQVLEHVTIPPGKTQTVAGRVWTAGERPLRISTKWLQREGSMTPIGADHAAFARSNEGTTNVKKELREYLEKIGLRSEASEADAWTFYGSLAGEERAHADKLNTRAAVRREVPTGTGTNSSQGTGTTPPNNPSPEEGGGGNGSGTGTGGTRSSTNTPPNPPGTGTGTTGRNSNPTAVVAGLDLRGETDPARIAQMVLQHDRDRQRSLEELFGDSEPELLAQYRNDTTMTAERAAPELARRLRQQLRPGVGANGSGGHIGIHSRGFETDVTVEALTGALIMRSATEPGVQQLDHPCFATPEARALNIPAYLRSNVNDDTRQRHTENAHRLRGISMIRLCEYGLRLAGQQVPHDETEIVRRAFSTNSMEAIFTTSVNARLLSGYMDAGDSTRGWTAEDDVPNFLKNERVSMGKTPMLTKHARGGQADHADMTASKEEFRIARYSQQWAIDEMDVIDDAFGASNQYTPEDMGRAAMQLRPNLVYGIIHGNPTLLATGRALFNATDGNTGAGGLTLANIESAEAYFGDLRIRDRPLDLALRYLLVPRQLRWLAWRLVNGGEIRDDASTAGRYTIINPITQQQIEVVFDSRLGVGGVTDPNSGVKYAGSATGWYATCRPGENGAKTILVAYRRGTGRVPEVRSSLMQRGSWGYHYDIKHDIGAAPLDWRGMRRYTG